METAPKPTPPALDGGDGSERIDAVVARLRERLPAAQQPLLETFVRRYYADVDSEDLDERSADDLYGAALSHWHFARGFAGGQPRLRVFNPRVDEHGWQSTHTVIEIVNDDMPFLVDSITMEVNRQGLTLHLIVHPVLKMKRDAAHQVQALLPADDHGEGRMESLIHVEVDRRTDPARLQALHDGLLRILGDVRAAVDDWQPMRAQLIDAVRVLERQPPPVPAEDLAEDLAFLHWLAEDNFTFLGQRDYDLFEEGGEDVLRVVPGSGLGILRAGAGAEAASASFAALPPEVRAQARQARVLLLTKANARSTVHRPGHLDYVGVKRFDASGQVVGERRFLGLFTSVAYSAKAVDIPLLRRKVAAVTARAGFVPRSHATKTLMTILEQFPRDELFQISVDDLHRIATGILRLGERQRTRLFLHRDVYGRFASCLVYVPRENYNTDVRARMQAVLTEALNGESSEFSVQFSDSPLARVLIVVRTPAGEARDVDVHALEQRLVRITRRWEDELRVALIEACGEERGNALHERYAHGFSPGYRHDHGPRQAVHDIELMESLQAPGSLAMSLYRPLEAPPGRLRFKLLRSGELAPLSQSLPLLENMGVSVIEERPYEIHRHDGTELWIDDFSLALPTEDDVDVEALRPRFQETLRRTWRGDNENDGFNRLVLLAGLDWRGVALLRACMRYMKQGGFALSRAYIQQTLTAYPAIAADLVALFQARFDPDLAGDRDDLQAAIVSRLTAALDTVANLDEDRILRQFLSLMLATLRTNFYQRAADGGFKPVIAIKLDPAEVPGLPEPRPLYEIFVHSPRVEGVHLRFGRVARGGLRWSDRLEDFRTEVLGLVKAQQVKNTVIVPVGSKGGFVVRNPPPGGDREALLAEGVACYQAYLRGLLDVTDNLDGNTVVPPPRVVRHDGDDPYLVVAADKGTATFSDIANRTAAEYGFWLGDAFASGGSAGYDHKKMGITARGAWESVKHHFRSLGHDTQTQDFTVVGVGDMSGDVFGNGMLLSRHIRLVAAFDHRHIFIDPQPQAASSYAERERLFALPRSSWADYDKGLISAGGGVWPRSAKTIALSPEARATLGIDDDVKQMSPTELVHAILLAPVDLFYNGGIGTYVKASDESHAECGDRANDATRVNGRELRCKVVAEGGNLGCTQRGRIEFALAGGLVNTDAIDNSAGVDCSDHEVNIKILLNAVVRDGELTPKQRDKLLAQMTDDVAALCLRDNTFQNQVLGVALMRGVDLLDEQQRYLRHLVASGRLNRALEFLPDDDTLAERAKTGTGLTTPEQAVLLAYGKMELSDQVVASDVPEDPYIATTLQRYFPAQLAERYPDALQRHPLRREIIATHVVNSMVNRVGPTFVHRLGEETGAAAPDIVRAYLGTRQIFDLVPLWQANDALGHMVSHATRNGIVLATLQLIERGTVWLLHERDALHDMDATIRRFAPGVAEVGAGLERWLVDSERQALEATAAQLTEAQVPPALAQRVARLDAQLSGLDIVEVAGELGLPVDTVAGVYFGVGGRLALGWLSQQIVALPARSHWQGLARLAMRSDLSSLARELARSVLKDAGAERDAAALIEHWSGQRGFRLGRCQQLLGELQPLARLDPSMLAVLLRELRALV
ncbi:NAD-glutamate dehydrogenase [Rubrivivax albus]|uniref:NAD-glutamate dehydrogenase n=1 Tax=Rubrivivax albus TaxID=2499835 RepID=A0A437JSD4_9BURK|nr:NAD-glutamate dehydrogenase [Rubrivivax albus]RVT49752.1 NAD-glutamate dehydrogenase [Rubrivivax albus]